MHLLAFLGLLDGFFFDDAGHSPSDDVFSNLQQAWNFVQ
jgi:hypothetical protein